MINIKDFDPKLLKLDKKLIKNIGVCYIGYITKKDEYKINNVNVLFNNVLFHRIDGFIEEKEGSKVWSGIKNCIEKINNGKSGEYGIRF